MFFNQYLQQNNINTSADVLDAAFNEWCLLATQAGINANELAQSHYLDGFYKAAQLPTLTKKDKNKCYLFVATKTLRCGLSCPILVFGSFRHGGIKHIFNSAQWLWKSYKQLKSLSLNSSTKIIKQTLIPSNTTNTRINKGFLFLHKHFVNLSSANSSHIVLQTKCPWLTEQLLTRVTIKSGVDNRGAYIICPLEDTYGMIKGYQRIYQYTISGRNTNKDFSVCQMGAKKGAFIKFSGQKATNYIAVCEGLTTALALIDIEPAPIYVALDAGNLLPVCSAINEKIRIYADNDCWKPHVGNTGLKAATKVANIKQNTEILHPPVDDIPNATDYNDLRNHISTQAFMTIIAAQQHR